jgi:hypothetical protein
MPFTPYCAWVTYYTLNKMKFVQRKRLFAIKPLAALAAGCKMK